MDMSRAAAENMRALKENAYPGRGIVIGQTPDARRFAQVYWIMGRSENSRNRVFVKEADTVRTAPYDESKVEDPSLIIYNCIRTVGRCHIVSNGDQTDTIAEALAGGGSFESALFTRTFEPDAPNFTPRISGLVDLDSPHHAYSLAILKAVGGSGDRCTRQFFHYEKAIPGIGHCVTTYSSDGNPLPAFDGEPYAVPLVDDIDEVARSYWETLNADNKVALLVKFIDAETGQSDLRIVNKHA